jgi:DNA-binding transcriptional regulator GbsR (MarR family)
MDRLNEKMIEETVVDGDVIQLIHEDVPLAKVELDKDNPRLRYRLILETNKNGNGEKPKSLSELILGLSEVKLLQKDIEHNGGLRERVILKENGNGKFKAVEGNCRLTCIQALHKKYPDDPRWQKIPARILPKDVNPKHVAILLSDLHVSGKIKWEAHEKAGQIYYMSEELNMNQDDIAVYFRTSKSTVSRYLQAYKMMMETFLKIDNEAYVSAGRKKWSFFDEFFKKKDLRDLLKADPEFGNQFCRWVGDEKLRQGAEVRLLPTILRIPTARKAFEDGKSIEEVKKLIDTAEPEQGSDFFKLLSKMHDACTSAAQIKEILRIRTDDVARQKLVDTYEAMVSFMMLADVELPKAKGKGQ